MSTIVLDTLNRARSEVSTEFDQLNRALEDKKKDLKRFENHVLEVQDMVHELDYAIQRETKYHFDGKISDDDIPF